ncbi:hypothetical protein [Bradyrhizobium sp. MOS003]|jgi:hypothetical protein|uniref:hypothetical protein n=1 Tax=Bradyrhizobium sp. MOS003 TaxID=2133946 RepID=UPI000D12FD2F|nr:hypothetical protein [Bradyrhizobium sp. MOS003]PSO15545.1 hypothetical protein C7G42_26245 [Bradyrhizobium sp. MOS003]
MTHRRLLGIILATCISSSAFAGTSAGWGQGGKLEPYEAMIAQANSSGELFRIQGVCKSACTMFLSIRNVCVEPGAKLMFHAGVSPAVTARMAATYNGALRSYVEGNHFMDSRTFHAVPGSVLISKFGYKACPRQS